MNTILCYISMRPTILNQHRGNVNVSAQAYRNDLYNAVVIQIQTELTLLFVFKTSAIITSSIVFAVLFYYRPFIVPYVDTSLFGRVDLDSLNDESIRCFVNTKLTFYCQIYYVVSEWIALTKITYIGSTYNSECSWVMYSSLFRSFPACFEYNAW